MGLDFIGRARPSFEKGWSKRFRELCEPDLFNQAFVKSSITLIASRVDKATMEGEELVAMLEADQIALIRGIMRIGCIQQPPEVVVRQIRDVGGFTYAKIARINVISGTADVELWGGDPDGNK